MSEQSKAGATKDAPVSSVNSIESGVSEEGRLSIVEGGCKGCHQPVLLSVEVIDHHPKNPRIVRDQEHIVALAGNMAAAGQYDVTHAIKVRRKSSDRYEVYSGAHRFEGCKLAGLKDIWCYIFDLSDLDTLVALGAENLQRELGSLELGRLALEVRATGKHGDQAELAKAWGVRPDALSRYLAAAEVWETVHSCVNASGVRNKGEHLSIVRTLPPELWVEGVKAVIENGLTVSATRQAIRDIREAKGLPPRHEVKKQAGTHETEIDRQEPNVSGPSEEGHTVGREGASSVVSAKSSGRKRDDICRSAPKRIAAIEAAPEGDSEVVQDRKEGTLGPVGKGQQLSKASIATAPESAQDGHEGHVRYLLASSDDELLSILTDVGIERVRRLVASPVARHADVSGGDMAATCLSNSESAATKRQVDNPPFSDRANLREGEAGETSAVTNGEEPDWVGLDSLATRDLTDDELWQLPPDATHAKAVVDEREGMELGSRTGGLERYSVLARSVMSLKRKKSEEILAKWNLKPLEAGELDLGARVVAIVRDGECAVEQVAIGVIMDASVASVTFYTEIEFDAGVVTLVRFVVDLTVTKMDVWIHAEGDALAA